MIIACESGWMLHLWSQQVVSVHRGCQDSCMSLPVSKAGYLAFWTLKAKTRPFDTMAASCSVGQAPDVQHRQQGIPEMPQFF